MRNASCQQGENERDRKPKKKIEQEHKQHFFFVTTYDISFIKRELGSFTL